MDELEKWLKAEKGRVSRLAEACGITHGAVSQWRTVPHSRVLMVERITGIPRQRLRPDLYEAAEIALAGPVHTEHQGAHS